jgi:hypothetical protein
MMTHKIKQTLIPLTIDLNQLKVQKNDLESKSQIILLEDWNLKNIISGEI